MTDLRMNITAPVSEAADLTAFVVHSFTDCSLGYKIWRLVSRCCFDRKHSPVMFSSGIPQEMGLLTWNIGRRSFGSHSGLQCTLVLEEKTVLLGNVLVYLHLNDEVTIIQIQRILQSSSCVTAVMMLGFQCNGSWDPRLVS